MPGSQAVHRPDGQQFLNLRPGQEIVDQRTYGTPGPHLNSRLCSPNGFGLKHRVQGQPQNEDKNYGKCQHLPNADADIPDILQDRVLEIR